jgi:hypothetical protein
VASDRRKAAMRRIYLGQVADWREFFPYAEENGIELDCDIIMINTVINNLDLILNMGRDDDDRIMRVLNEISFNIEDSDVEEVALWLRIGGKRHYVPVNQDWVPLD